jgi:hypothetical protein
VSDGALSFYHDRFVCTRISKFTYGTFFSPVFDPAASDHQQRLHNVSPDVDGVRTIVDCFDVILPKVCLFYFVNLIARC